MRAQRVASVVSAVVTTVALAVSTSPTASSAQPTPSGPSTAAPCLPGRGSAPPGFRHDAVEPTRRQIAAADAALRSAEQSTGQSTGQPAATAKRRVGNVVRVRVYVHVLRTRAGGGVTHHRIERQIEVLNSGFAGEQSPAAAASPFRFELADIDVTVNARWSRMDEGTLAEAHAKRSLHRGGPTDLNLYIGHAGSGSFGWGTQPTELDRAPKLDGVVIARRTMPGGAGGHYSAGDAVVHETGHWLGLFHTFAGKCEGRGDLVADTPREARPSYACPTHRDTCAAPGNDPVHNFMDYSYDSCVNQFTAGQVSRMERAWRALRAEASMVAPSSARR
jgi:hypothetical protein